MVSDEEANVKWKKRCTCCPFCPGTRHCIGQLSSVQVPVKCVWRRASFSSDHSIACAGSCFMASPAPSRVQLSGLLLRVADRYHLWFEYSRGSVIARPLATRCDPL